MTTNNASSIKHWIKQMGFKLSKSHVLISRSLKINYYTLDNFGIYEETTFSPERNTSLSKKSKKFVSWTPWGEDMEINSVRDISKAYADFMVYNPRLVVN